MNNHPAGFLSNGAGYRLWVKWPLGSGGSDLDWTGDGGGGEALLLAG